MKSRLLLQGFPYHSRVRLADWDCLLGEAQQLGWELHETIQILM